MLCTALPIVGRSTRAIAGGARPIHPERTEVRRLSGGPAAQRGPSAPRGAGELPDAHTLCVCNAQYPFHLATNIELIY